MTEEIYKVINFYNQGDATCYGNNT